VVYNYLLAHIQFELLRVISFTCYFYFYYSVLLDLDFGSSVASVLPVVSKATSKAAAVGGTGYMTSPVRHVKRQTAVYCTRHTRLSHAPPRCGYFKHSRRLTSKRPRPMPLN